MNLSLKNVLTALSMAFFFGCVSHESLGDRSLAAGNYKEALDNYVIQLDSGSKDPELYSKAARAAFRIGNFATSERYYSRALSLGAGIEVARELAQLYVRTSNYASAVRVYQYLIVREKDPQPVYNNLGPALMYAGSPMDAESYLLVAQQMNPADPYPYVNLGLLYDRHLNQPWRSAAFYRCFEELISRRSTDLPMVAQRRSEIEEQYALRARNEQVKCGKAYYPAEQSSPSLSTLREEMKKIDDQFLIDGSETGKAPTVEDLEVEEPKVVEKPVKADPTIAMIAYREGRLADAKKMFESLPVNLFDAETTRAYGDTLRRLKEYKESERWLEMSMGFSDMPDTVEMLVDVVANTGNDERRTALCLNYGKRPGYAKLATPCRDVIGKEVKVAPTEKKNGEK